MTIMTPERIAVLQDLWTDQHPWAVLCQTLADFPGGAYSDYGQWDLMMWFMTGDSDRATTAITKISGFPDVPTDGNFSREYGHQLALFYHWLYDELDVATEASWRQKLNNYAEFMLGSATYPNVATRDGDSDQVVGHYLAIRLIDSYIGSDWMHAPSLGVGYLDASGMMNRLTQYVGLAGGGSWIESSEYNLNTPCVMLTGMAEIGFDQFSEYADWFPELCQALIWEVTQDLQDCVKWGDIEHPHDLDIVRRIPLMCQLIGAGFDTDGSLLRLLGALVPLHSTNEFYLDMYRLLWFFDPRTIPINPVVPKPTGLRVSDGVGLCVARTEDTLVQTFAALYVGVDHQMTQWNVRVFFEDEFVLDSIDGYIAPRSNYNSGLTYGLEPMPDRTMPTAETLGDGSVHVQMRTGGPRYGSDYYQPPPDFLTSWTRDITFLGNEITVSDAFDGIEPTGTDRYFYNGDREAIEGAAAPWQQLWHAAAPPTETASGYTWSTPLGKLVALNTDAPDKSWEVFDAGRWLIRLKASGDTATINSTFTWDIGTDTAFVVDSCTDAAGTAFTSHVGEIGANWTALASLSNQAAVVITDANRIRPSTAPANGALLWASGQPPSADYYVEATMHVFSLPASGYVGLAIRVDPDTGNSYWAIYNLATSQWELYSLVGPTYTPIGNSPQSLTIGQDYALRFEAIEDQITLYVDGDEAVSVTDGDITDAGKAGVLLYGAFTNSTGLHLDNINGDIEATAAVGFIPHRLLLLLPWPEIGSAFAPSAPTATVHPTLFSAMPPNKGHLALRANKGHLTIPDQR